MYRTATLATFAALGCLTAHAADKFSNDANSAWADTPKGRFECLQDKTDRTFQAFRFGGKTIYRGNLGNFTGAEQSLKTGFSNTTGECPYIVASNQGYVILSRSIQPPSFGISDYIVIDFNSDDYTITELAEGQRPNDEKVPDAWRIKWRKDSFTFTYFGYPQDQPGGSLDSPKPRRHVIRYDFESGAADQVK